MALQRALEAGEVEDVRILVERTLERRRRPVVVAVERLALVPVVRDEVPGAEHRVVLLDPHPERLIACLATFGRRGRLDGTGRGRTAGMGRPGSEGRPTAVACRGPWRRVTPCERRCVAPASRRGPGPSRSQTNRAAAMRSAEVPGLRRLPWRRRSRSSRRAAASPRGVTTPPARTTAPARAATAAAAAAPAFRAISVSGTSGHQLEMGLGDGVEEGQAATERPAKPGEPQVERDGEAADVLRRHGVTLRRQPHGLEQRDRRATGDGSLVTLPEPARPGESDRPVRPARVVHAQSAQHQSEPAPEPRSPARARGGRQGREQERHAEVGVRRGHACRSGHRPVDRPAHSPRARRRRRRAPVR